MLEIFKILLVVLLVLANGFFVASEFALVGVRRSRIQTLADSGNDRAKRLLRLLNHLNAYISATQLGITLASLGLGWIGEPAVAHLLEMPLEGRVSETVLETISFAVAFSIITFLHIVIGELAPKTLALERAERVALAISLPMELFYKAFRWPIRLLDWAGTRTVRLFGLHPSGEHGSIYTEEELRQLIESSRQSGHVEEQEQKLINRVFDFTDAEVREAMVPRTEVEAIPVTASLAETKRAFRTHGYSRLPVYREKLDDIVGVAYRRDVEPFLDSNGDGEFDLEKLLHPPMFVPVSARLGTVLKRMQEMRVHLAFVIDEHGGMEGIVTLEDLLEEIVGEIEDEFDEETRSQLQKRDGHYVLDGMLAVKDLNRRLEVQVPEDGSYMTVAGFLLSEAGRLLREGESVEYKELRFTVERVERNRLKRIRLEFVEEKNGQNAVQLLVLGAVLAEEVVSGRWAV
jgi:CBS domain containing-hemolysin-like protein